MCEGFFHIYSQGLLSLEQCNSLRADFPLRTVLELMLSAGTLTYGTGFIKEGRPVTVTIMELTEFEFITGIRNDPTSSARCSNRKTRTPILLLNTVRAGSHFRKMSTRTRI